MELQPGTRIDRYVVETLLGRGGMASVYKVRHASLDSSFALKVLDLPRRSIRERLKEEGRIQARLKHPNLVSVVDQVEVDGCPGLVMEYVNGPSLDGYLERQRLTLAQVDALATDLLKGLKAAHAAGLVHRDLKPANVLLSRAPDGSVTPKIADFGLAKLIGPDSTDQAMTRTGQVMGTPLYMAPEQFKNAKDVDERADIYAMGVMLYELATHQRPYDGNDLFEIHDRVQAADWPRPRELVPDLPERMERAILGAMQVDRAARTPDCDHLLADWRGQAHGKPSDVSWDLPEPERAEPMPRAVATFAPLAEPPSTPTWSEPELDLEAPVVVSLTPGPKERYLPPPPRARATGLSDLVRRGGIAALALGVLAVFGGMGARLFLFGEGTVVLDPVGDAARIRVAAGGRTLGTDEPVPVGSWPYQVSFSGGAWRDNPSQMRVLSDIPTVVRCDATAGSCSASPRLTGPTFQFQRVTRELQGR